MLTVVAVSGALLAACMSETTGSDDASAPPATQDATTPLSQAERDNPSCAEVSDAELATGSVVSSQVVDADGDVPSHCLVDVEVRTPGDEIVGHNTVAVRVGLPDDWNGDFYFAGVGGFAGVLGDLTPGLTRGYASASTDTGHQGQGDPPTWDGSWALGNVPKQLDWGYRGTHVATLAAKELTEVYYDAAPETAYFDGCSNGGRQGLMEIQRYPSDYDAVLARSPSISAVDMFATWIRQLHAFLDDPDAWLAPGDLEALASVTSSVAAAQDAAIDGIVVAPGDVRVDRDDVADVGLTKAQADAAITLWEDHTIAGGGRTLRGMPPGHEQGWQPFITGSTPPEAVGDSQWTFPDGPESPAAFTLTNEFLRYFVYDDASASMASFDLDTDLGDLEPFREMLDASEPDISEFADDGGKLLMVHGWADPALSAWQTIDYHNAVADELGSAVEDAVALYMVPAMYHCGGGPGLTELDALGVLEEWVRTDRRPGAMAVGSEDGRTATLCPHPAVPQSSDGASTWEC